MPGSKQFGVYPIFYQIIFSSSIPAHQLSKNNILLHPYCFHVFYYFIPKYSIVLIILILPWSLSLSSPLSLLFLPPPPLSSCSSLFLSLSPSLLYSINISLCLLEPYLLSLCFYFWFQFCCHSPLESPNRENSNLQHLIHETGDRDGFNILTFTSKNKVLLSLQKLSSYLLYAAIPALSRLKIYMDKIYFTALLTALYYITIL